MCFRSSKNKKKKKKKSKHKKKKSKSSKKHSSSSSEKCSSSESSSSSESEDEWVEKDSIAKKKAKKDEDCTPIIGPVIPEALHLAALASKSADAKLESVNFLFLGLFNNSTLEIFFSFVPKNPRFCDFSKTAGMILTKTWLVASYSYT